LGRFASSAAINGPLAKAAFSARDGTGSESLRIVNRASVAFDRIGNCTEEPDCIALCLRCARKQQQSNVLILV
jgi:hypothetical protein